MGGHRGQNVHGVDRWVGERGGDVAVSNTLRMSDSELGRNRVTLAFIDIDEHDTVDLGMPEVQGNEIASKSQTDDRDGDAHGVILVSEAAATTCSRPPTG